MHPEAHAFCQKAAAYFPAPAMVVEYGSRNVNGSARDVWPDTPVWIGYDKQPGAGVNVVRDIATMDMPDPSFDLGISTEMLEHCYAAVCFDKLVASVKTGGHVLVTCATDPRAPHSAVDGGPIRDTEWYRNVEPELLEHPHLRPLLHEVHTDRGDLYYLGEVNRGDH